MHKIELMDGAMGSEFIRTGITLPDHIWSANVNIEAEEIVYQFCTISAPRTQNIIAMEDSQLRTDLIMLCNANDTEMGSPQ